MIPEQEFAAFFKKKLKKIWNPKRSNCSYFASYTTYKRKKVKRYSLLLFIHRCIHP
jgi:hypothetical protein